ncbi:MAG: hypothetical protein FJ098_02220 [Deltaproteobacteria bacterium]|nr:hypothetical protein [Deltaproteobacteria bacterium]
MFLFVHMAGACTEHDKGIVGENVNDERVSLGTPPSNSGEGTSNTGAWWEQGPGADEGPPAGMEPAVVSADLECLGDDPFHHLFTCPGACHFIVGTITSLEVVPDGHVSNFGDGKYFVADTRVAMVTIDTWLANPPVFEDAPFSAAPNGAFVVQEQPHGFADIYFEAVGDLQPTYQKTQWDKQWVVPDHAELPKKGPVVLGVKDARDIIHPDHRLAAVVLPITNDGLVDMTSLMGTGVMADAGWPADTPTDPISIKDAQEWFSKMVKYNGVRCFPSEVEEETDIELPGD